MKIRKMKKSGIIFKNLNYSKKKPEQYKKGWSRFQEHHIESRSEFGDNSKNNKIVLSGKIHYCWHQIFGNLNPLGAKLFVILFLYGFKRKWTIKDVRKVIFSIKKNNISEAMQIAGYHGIQDRRVFKISNRFANKKRKPTIDLIKVNSNFLWCWNELFKGFNADEIQIFISIMFGNSRKKWNIKSIKALKKAITENKIQEAASIAGLGMEFLYFMYTDSICESSMAIAV